MIRDRVARWLDWLFERFHHGRPRPATHRRREVEHAHRARAAIVNYHERRLTLCEEELNMLWGRHRAKQAEDE